MAAQTDKKPRLTQVDILMDPAAEIAYFTAKYALDAACEQLLSTYPDRVARAMLLAGHGADDVEARGRIAERVLEEDEAELLPYQRAADAALETVETCKQTFKFRSLGRKTFRDLVRKHPAPDEDHEALQAEVGSTARARWNDEGLSRELLHLASVSPSLTVEMVDEIFDGPNWNDAEVLLLKTAALGAQLQGQQN